MKNSLGLFLTAMAVGILGISGCTDHQERYDDPPWLGGSSIETLEERGNYTIFLRLMEKANYKDPITKQLFTLFVPDDDAFEAYFASAGISSVEDLTDDESVQLFTLHVLRNPRSRYYLIYEYAWSEFQSPKAEYASLFHRKITPSTSIPYKEVVRYVPGMVGQELLIYTGNKNIPLFSAEWFDDYGGADDGSDYLFMYPGSTWEEGYPEGMKGMNWHNAMIIPNPEIPDEMEVRTSSGFIYFLDRVVPPMPSIEEYMIANQDKYGLYYDILQRFAAYGNSKVDEERNVLYRKSYDLVYPLSEELASSTNTAVPPQNMWTALLPPDNILQPYLDQNIFKYYSSIDSVPRVTLFYILQSQLSATLVLKSKMANGYFNAFGDPTDFGPNDIVSGYMCSNGVVYETKRVLEPNVFTTVPGLLFFDKDYSTLLFVFNQANMLSSISNPDLDVTVFATTNQKLEEYGIRYNATSDVIEFRGPVDGTWAPMKSTEMTLFAQDQIYKGILDLQGPDQYAEMSSGNYIIYGNNLAQAGENTVYNRPATVGEVVVNEQNGLLVKVDYPIESRMIMGQILTCNPADDECLLADPDMSEFAKVLVDLKLLDDRFKDPITKESQPRLKFLAGADYWTAFIPTNAAMEQARTEGIIPYGIPKTAEGKDSLENFVMYHFIRDRVVFDNGVATGEFKTNYVYKDTLENANVYALLRVNNEPQNLSLTDRSGQEVFLDHAKANILVRQGAMHKIDAVLKYTEE
ncbi:MAG: fasciclin domain-containing protein [Bacteroidota bacterium]